MEKLAIHGGRPVRKEKLYYGHQLIEDDDIQSVIKILQGDYLTCGPNVKNMETDLVNYTGAKYAVAVSNGTAALHCACLAAGIGPGDEVITTPITFAASSNCVLYCGATPIFADIDPETYTIDPLSIEKHITHRTKAIVAVDFTGQAVLDDRSRTADEHRMEHQMVSLRGGVVYKGQGHSPVAVRQTEQGHLGRRI